MKRLVVFIALLLFVKLSEAQNVQKCEQIVSEVYKAINQKDAEPIMKYLSDDFSIAGQSGSIARMILPQLFSQLNEQVSDIRKKSEHKTNVLKMEYEAQFKKMGKITSTFIFNEKDQLKSMDLFPMKVMTKDTDAQIQSGSEDYFTVPFQKAGNLIMVKALLNGEQRNFILDSGSPVLVLNNNHQKSTSDKGGKSISNAIGVGGAIDQMGLETIGSLQFGEIGMDSQEVISMDLSHLEKELRTSIHGLIGYEVIKDYDVLFDYKKKRITFIKPEYTEQYFKQFYSSKKQIQIPIDMQAHIAIVEGKINGKEYTLGIDCGAESSLLDVKYKESLLSSLKKIKEEQLAGADKSITTILIGKLKNMEIAGIPFETELAFNDMDPINKGYQMKLDGLIGYDILSKQPTLISYENKKLVFLK